MKLFSEAGNIYRFFYKTPTSERRGGFFAEKSGYYPYFLGVNRGLTDNFQQTVSYVTSDSLDPVLKAQNPYLRAFYINKLLPSFMRFVDCKVFVMTLTDLNQFYLKRSRNPVHYVYVFHALVSTHMMYKRGAFDYYDSILCAGPYHIQEIRRYEKLAGLKPKKLVEAGYYRLDRIYETCKNQHFLPVASGKKTVLIAPSWGDKNILESCGEELITILLKAGYKVIVRPHPETIRRSPALIAKLESVFVRHPEFTLEKSVASDESLTKADVLICDCSGVALEYAFGTERPVLFIDVPPKVKNPKFRELELEPFELELRQKIGVIVSPGDLRAVPATIGELISKKNAFRDTIITLRNKNVFALGESSRIGAQYIMDLL